MGGQVEPEKLHDFLWELHISELKFEACSNIVLIGKIKKGTYFHRALLFKVIYASEILWAIDRTLSLLECV